jgi:GT2 family glycosyltransferase
MFCRAVAVDALLPRWKIFNGYLLRHWGQNTTREVDILSGCFWFIRREALGSVGLLDEGFFMYGEDMDWCKRFWKAGWRVVFVPQGEAIHYGGKSSSNAPVRFYIEKQRADLQYWRKHHGRIGMCAYFLILCIHHSLRIIGYSVAVLLPRSNKVFRFKAARSLYCLGWMMRLASRGLRPESLAVPVPVT